MTDQADKIIAEALGLCWHEWTVWSAKSDERCKKCGVCKEDSPNPDFSTPEGFFKIMELGPSRDWWRSFIQWWWRDISYGYAMMAPSSVQEPFEFLLMREFNPALFSGKLVEFLRERGEK